MSIPRRFHGASRRRAAANLLTRDEARRIAINIARLPELVKGNAGARAQELAYRWVARGVKLWPRPTIKE